MLLYPYGLAVLDFDRLYRALLCAQSAADAAALNIEITRPARFQIQFIGHSQNDIFLVSDNTDKITNKTNTSANPNTCAG